VHVELVPHVRRCVTDGDSGGDVRRSSDSDGTAEVSPASDTCSQTHFST